MLSPASVEIRKNKNLKLIVTWTILPFFLMFFFNYLLPSLHIFIRSAIKFSTSVSLFSVQRFCIKMVRNAASFTLACLVK